MGRYGIDWDKGYENFTDEDWNTVLTETTKIIDKKESVREVAFSLNDRGIYYEEIEEYEKAISDLDYAIKLIPNFAYAFFNRGYTYWSMKQYDKALADFNEALNFYPTLQGTEKSIEKTKKAIKMILEEKEANNG
jgi:tetratricopeptide (TPR) repeat protein